MRPGHPTLPTALLRIVWETAGRPPSKGVPSTRLADSARRMARAADKIADTLSAWAGMMDTLAAGMETRACPCGNPLPVQRTGRPRERCSDRCRTLSRA